MTFCTSTVLFAVTAAPAFALSSSSPRGRAHCGRPLYNVCRGVAQNRHTLPFFLLLGCNLTWTVLLLPYCRLRPRPGQPCSPLSASSTASLPPAQRHWPCLVTASPVSSSSLRGHLLGLSVTQSFTPKPSSSLPLSPLVYFHCLLPFKPEISTKGPCVEGLVPRRLLLLGSSGRDPERGPLSDAQLS